MTGPLRQKRVQSGKTSGVVEVAGCTVLPRGGNYGANKVTESRGLFSLAKELCSEVITLL